MNLTDIRFVMTGMSYKYKDPWEIEIVAIIVEFMSIEIVQDCFTHEDLQDYYHFMQEHFQSDDSLEEKVNKALEGLTNHGLLEKRVVLNNYILSIVSHIKVVLSVLLSLKMLFSPVGTICL